jgi:hypothetical protein
MPWYSLAGFKPEEVNKKFAELVALQSEAQAVSLFVGQSLEIAVLRALQAQTDLAFQGDFLDLEEHDDSTLYSKEEPPSSLSGHRIPGRKRLDFLVHHATGGFAGIEVKNVRQWTYPAREEVRELLLKCCALDVVPVLIARRIQFSTFSALNPCGVILHQTFNQLYPNFCANDLVPKLRNKTLLGFHDIRVIDAPDAANTHARLEIFIHRNLPEILPAARIAFDGYKDLLSSYANKQIDYQEFVRHVRRRQRGEAEDIEPLEPDNLDIPDEW